MATMDLGRIRLFWKGTFDETAAYVYLDAVVYNGSSYMCNSATGTIAGEIPGASAKWVLIAAKGEQGVKGDTATVTIGNVATGEAGSEVIVKNVGTENDAILDITIPQGIQGIQGIQGEAATISVGTITTGEAGSAAVVENVGTANDAIFNFVIPQGIQGIQGPKGEKGDPFAVFKTYLSVSEMEADAANVPDGKFVMIAGDVEEVDTGKLYVKAGEAFEFITDLSGAQGIKGETGKDATVTLNAQSGIVAANVQGTIQNLGSEGDADFLIQVPKGATFVPSVSEDGVISWTNDGGLENPAEVDITGPQGIAATIEVGSVTTVASDADAKVENVGTKEEAVFNFEIPQGKAATVQVGEVTTGAAGSQATVTNVGTAEDAIFNFAIPQGVKGDTATIAIKSVTTGAAGSEASVVNVGTANDAELEIVIPRGDKGETATVEVGNVTTVASDKQATVKNVGTENDAIFDFEIPQGKAATVKVGSVVTGEAGSQATVTNVGTAEDAEFNFVIPQGVKGDKGDKGDEGQSIVGATIDENGHLIIQYGFLSEQA